MKHDRPFLGKRFLVTCGPTWVKIDDVRVLSNCSTGKMGHLLASRISKVGGEVTLLEGPVERRWKSKTVKVIPFQYFEDLERLIDEEATKGYDVVVHAAAVSDYRLTTPYHGKISSNRKSLSLRLDPTPKLINAFKKLNPNCLLVGFKLEPDLNPDRLSLIVGRLKRDAGCDVIIANSLSDQAGYQGVIMDSQGLILDQAHSRSTMAEKITRVLEGMF
jgi:phosphopantothenoylcysteine decarboxylase / phosphopantothenate---cysteine ligase